MSANRLEQLFTRASAKRRIDLLALPIARAMDLAGVPAAPAYEILAREAAIGTFGGLFAAEGVEATAPIRNKKVWKQLLSALEAWVETWRPPPAPPAPDLPEPTMKVTEARDWFESHGIGWLFDERVSTAWSDETRHRDALTQLDRYQALRRNQDAARRLVAERLARVEGWRAETAPRATVPVPGPVEPLAASWRHKHDAEARTAAGDGEPIASPPRFHGADALLVEWPKGTSCHCGSAPRVTVGQAGAGCIGGHGACPRRTDALFWALEALRGTFGPGIARELARPAWARRLELVSAPAGRKSIRVLEIGWMVLAHGPFIDLMPLRRDGAGGWVALHEDDDISGADLRDRLLVRLEQTSDHPLEDVLTELVGHPRVVDDKGRPMTVRRERPALRLRKTKKGLTADLSLADGTSVLHDGQVARVLCTEGSVVLVDATRQQAWVAHQLREIVPTVPVDAAQQVIERMAAVAGELPLDIDRALAGPEVAADPRPVVHLHAGTDGVTISLRVRPFGDGPAYVPGAGARRVVRGQPLAQTERDLDVERRLASDVAAALGLGESLDGLLATPDALAAALDAVNQLGDRVVVAWEGPPKRRLRALRARDLRVAVSRTREWLTIGGDARVDDALVELEALLMAARDDRRFVAVADGVVEIADDLKAHLAHLARVATADARVPALAAGEVAALADAGATVEGGADWREWLDRAAAAKDVPTDVPATFLGTLRPYQVDGYAWLARLAAWAPGALLCDDMGLGKTAQTLALLLARQGEGAALVVAPTSVVDNWRREAERFAPSLRIVVHQGDRRAKSAAPSAGEVWVTSWDLLVRDLAVLKGVGWSTVVFDEAHAAKNPDSKRSQAARALSAGFRVALTGTPIENRLADLWALAAAAVPGLFGPWELFRERFATPIERDRDDDARKHLARLLRPFLLRRTKGEVARDLPPRIEIVERIVPTAEELAAYHQERIRALAKLQSDDVPPNQRRFQALAALTRLRQIACDPALVGDSGPVSSKVARLVERLLELRDEGRKALVFSSFTGLLDRAEAALAEAGATFLRLDGSTPAAARPALVERFQAGQADAFLISLKAGGTGLNLTAADTVFHLDPWWNPAAETQAADRAHRIGQTRSVTVYRLIAQGTVEEAVLAMQEDKRALVAAVLDETSAAAPVSPDELVALLAFGPMPPKASKATTMANRTGEPVIAEPRPADPPRPTRGRAAPVRASAQDVRVAGWDEPAFVAWATSSRNLSLASAKVYLAPARRFVAWCDGEGRPVDEAALDAWLATPDGLGSGSRAAGKHAVAWWATAVD